MRSCAPAVIVYEESLLGPFLKMFSLGTKTLPFISITADFLHEIPCEERLAGIHKYSGSI